LDLRTGKPCDYGKLAHEVERRMRRDRLKWRPAADAVASEANEDHAEAIVRTLNRRASKSATERPSPAAASPLPLLGAGLLYEHIKEVLVRIRREVTGNPIMPDDFFEVRAKTADLIRSWLERRQRDLTEAGRDAAIDLVGALVGELGAVEQVFGPGFLYDAEMIRLRNLIDMSRSLQLQIDVARPNSTGRDF
jgi:hypothetical protein